MKPNRAGVTRGEVRQVWLSVDQIRPSSENEEIYKPVSPRDPQIQELAQSIKEHGLKEPLVVTVEGYILSGHRRYVACQLAGIKDIPCRVEDISRNDPKFETMLREFNRQRVKSFDEVVREQVISMNPATAYQSLIKHRQETCAVNGDFLTIEGESAAKLTA
jgi:ParB/RepB/Spo0J family partition protein